MLCTTTAGRSSKKGPAFAGPFVIWSRELSLPLERLGPRDCPQDQQEQDGAEECQHDATDVEAGHVPAEQGAADESAEERADHADDDVAEDAEPSAAHRHT